MPKAWRYRLFRIGKMPAELAAAAADPDVLAAAEGVSVKATARSVRLPGLRSGRSLKLLVGSVVVLPTRLLASVGRYVVLDTDFGAGGREGQTLTLAGDGVHIHIDVRSVFPQGSGTVELRYRTPLDATVLERVPSTSCTVSLSDTVQVLLRGWA